jgi:Ca2+-binding RTX toxin-like protein
MKGTSAGKAGLREYDRIDLAGGNRVRTIRLIALPAALAAILVMAGIAVANGDGKWGFDNKFKGTDANDTFAGTPGKDLAIGKGGDDNLSGAGERDALFGGRGKDTLNGNDGNDWLIGGGDDDTMDGGPGDDVIVAARYVKQRRAGRGCDKGRTFGRCGDKGDGCDNDTRNMGCDKGRTLNGGKRGWRGGKRWRWVVAAQGKDTVTCGEGADKVFADKDDVVAADCEKVVRLEDKQARKNKRR